MLFDIERELSKHMNTGTLNYCIPRFFAFDGLKHRKIADGKRLFVNPFEYYAGSIRKIFNYQLTEENDKLGTRWIKKATVFKLNVKNDLSYNHKGFWIQDNRKRFDFPESGSFLKAIALLPVIKSMGYDTLYISDKLDNMFDLSDDLLNEFTPNDQFESFIEGARLLKLKILTRLNLTDLKDASYWDFLEKKLLFLSEIYSLDGVILELDSSAELSPLSRIIGRIKKFNPPFTFVFSSEDPVSTRSIKKLGFQSVHMDFYSQMKAFKNDNGCALLKLNHTVSHIPVMYGFEKSLIYNQQSIDFLKLALFNVYFNCGFIPCIRSLFNAGGDWDSVNTDLYSFLCMITEMKKRYSAFLSEDRELKGILTDSEKVFGHVYKNPVEDAALIILINTDNTRDHWITVDINSIGLTQYHRIKRKLMSFEDKVSYLDVEDGYVHVQLQPYEGTLLTVR